MKMYVNQYDRWLRNKLELEMAVCEDVTINKVGRILVSNKAGRMQYSDSHD